MEPRVPTRNRRHKRLRLTQTQKREIFAATQSSRFDGWFKVPNGETGEWSGHVAIMFSKRQWIRLVTHEGSILEFAADDTAYKDHELQTTITNYAPVDLNGN